MGTDRLLLVGRVVGVHGVRGWVKLESFTEPRTQIFSYRPWFVTTPDGEFEISRIEGQEHGRGLIVRLDGIEDRDAAQKLYGAEIRIRREALPQLEPGQVYWADLEGLQALTLQGSALGTVSHLFATGANDVLVVRDGKRERMIPYLPDRVVRDIDLDRGTITLDWDPDF